ncbi:MAG TPA: hypothetical protein DCL78_15560, partial [Gammaproteobacteria bacterium]|nr:hypothetical protein [Gammaproteobacteria bacterium]
VGAFSQAAISVAASIKPESRINRLAPIPSGNKKVMVRSFIFVIVELNRYYAAPQDAAWSLA